MSLPRTRARWIAVAIVPLLGVWIAQTALGRSESRSNRERPGEIDLMRLQYDSEGGFSEAYYNAYGRTWERWETDYPTAEENFATRLGQLTRVQPGLRGESVRLTDDHVFEHPFLFLSDPGWMRLSREERERFAEYLRRGGFAWVDDFWGDSEWENFAVQMRSALPDAEWRDIPSDHALLHTVFDLAAPPQIPARDFADGDGKEPPGLHRSPVGAMDPAHLRGLFDVDGRLLMVATHNTDIGDGFERESYGQEFFERYSTRAYTLGVNIVVYVLTH